MANHYTTETLSLKSTIGKIRNLDVKKLTIDGTDILSKTKTIIRDMDASANPDLDIGKPILTEDENGYYAIGRGGSIKHTYEDIKEGSISNPRIGIIGTATSIVDGKVLDAEGNNLLIWETDGLTDGNSLLNGNVNLINFDSGLKSLLYGRLMFKNCSNLSSFSVDMNRLIIGFEMFEGCTSLDTFDSNLDSLVSAYSMFSNCTSLKTFNSNLSTLKNGDYMFGGCTSLKTFNSNLSTLKNGDYMFSGCTSLETFNSNLKSIIEGDYMFSGCTSLKTFNSNLKSLGRGCYMFSGCTSLKSFDSDLETISVGENMFKGCTSLTSFKSNLNSLAIGKNMFSDCKLDAESVMTILHFLPEDTTYTHLITIGVGINNDETTKDNFAKDCICNSWEDLVKEFENKGWEVTWEFNGN